MGIPARVGRYEIVGELARGGMAELFVGRLPGIDGFAKQVAIKRVLPVLDEDRAFAQMLLDEARLAATLDHQNIVRVLDVGGDDDGYFLVMELLQGADVASLLGAVTRTGKALPPAIAIEIARGALAGLHYAHERRGADGTPVGVVHRDISPQNLFVTFDGGVKVLDFGIAKAFEHLPRAKTKTGGLRGKVPYMSPEQCNAERLDRRSDVFSLAVVLWEMTIGERLVGGNDESELAMLKQIVDRDAPLPSSKQPGYPPELERIVMRGLARDRNARYPTADAMQLELEALAKHAGWWTSPRELAAFLAGAFPDRVAQWADASRGTAPIRIGARVTAPLPAARATAEALPPTAASVKRRVWPIALGVALVALAIGGAYLLGRGNRDATTTFSSPAKSARVTEDVHFIQSDDVLVAHDPYKGERLDFLWVAKPLGNGKYLDGAGKEHETDNVWRTHVASADDLVIGTLAFCQAPSYLYKADAPKDRAEGRGQPWMLGRVTDISQLATGKVTVANVVCDVAGVRVVAN